MTCTSKYSKLKELPKRNNGGHSSSTSESKQRTLGKHFSKETTWGRVRDSTKSVAEARYDKDFVKKDSVGKSDGRLEQTSTKSTCEERLID